MSTTEHKQWIMTSFQFPFAGKLTKNGNRLKDFSLTNTKTWLSSSPSTIQIQEGSWVDCSTGLVALATYQMSHHQQMFTATVATQHTVLPPPHPHLPMYCSLQYIIVTSHTGVVLRPWTPQLPLTCKTKVFVTFNTTLQYNKDHAF